MSNRNVLLSSFAVAAAVQTFDAEADLLDTMIYEVLVESITGAPSAASLVAKFQIAPLYYRGVTLDAETSGNLLPWIDVVAADGFTGHLLLDGAWPATLADQTLASPRSVSRRLLIPPNCSKTRLVLTPSFTGGASPSFAVTVIAGTL